MKIMIKSWLQGNKGQVLGAGKARILEAVVEYGSLNAASRALNMPYRRVWSGIKAAEENLGAPLLTKKIGGIKGGGSVLTGQAVELLKRFKILEGDVKAFAEERFLELFDDYDLDPPKEIS